MKLGIFKPILIVFLVIFTLFFALLLFPLAFKGQILEIVKKEFNKSLTAEVDFQKVNINFIRSFPNASVSLENLYVAGKEEFEGDTLLFSKEIQLVVNVKSLFSKTGYEIEKISISDTRLFAHILMNGKANWDIVKPTTTTEKADTTSTFALKLNNFKIINSDVVFLQDSSNMLAEIKKINLNLNGDFTNNLTTLKTDINIDTIRLSNNGVALIPFLQLMFDAKIKADLENQKYVLAENSIKINEIPLALNGSVQLLEDTTQVDVRLKTGKVNFKSLLSLIPAIYFEGFEEVKADGKISLEGYAKGKLVGDNYPAFDFRLNINDAWFQYPELPQSVHSIELQSHISSLGGSLDNTVIDVSNFSFNMADNPFQSSLHITTPISDATVQFKANGKLDLGTVKKVYPLDKDITLNGLLSLQLKGNGKMSYIEKNRLEKFRFTGNVKMQDFAIKNSDFSETLNVDNANLIFNNRYLHLNKLNVRIGKNDIRGNGKVENYLAYALKGKTLKGRFSIYSNYLNLNDFITEETPNNTAKTTEKETTNAPNSVIEIPKNLDLALVGDMQQLKFHKMNFRNAYAKLVVLNGDIDIEKMWVKAFGGTMNVTGQYSSKNTKKPSAQLNVALNQIHFNSIFEQIESFQKIVPFFKNTTGTFNAKFSFNTLLEQDMSPNLQSITSKGNFKTKAIKIKDSSVINLLAEKLKLSKLSKMTSLRDISLAFEIKDGRISTKPFSLKLAGYKMQLAGSTGLDKTIDYKGKLRLPNKLKLGYFQNANFKIEGTFNKPKIKLDISETLNEIIGKENVKKEVQKIKESIFEKGKEKKEEAITEAKKRADEILQQAKIKGDKIIETARVTADSIVAHSKNPITKAITQATANKLIEKAQKEAYKIYEKAQKESQKEIEKANKKE